jgi:hypothetical protein
MERAMTVVCRNGHVSSTTDFCDQCGTPIAVVAAGEATEILPVIEEVDTSQAERPDERDQRQTQATSPGLTARTPNRRER